MRTAATWMHFVTYGLTELWTKESEEGLRSGSAYELTMLTPATDEPPSGC